MIEVILANQRRLLVNESQIHTIEDGPGGMARIHIFGDEYPMECAESVSSVFQSIINAAPNPVHTLKLDIGAWIAIALIILLLILRH